MKIQFIVCGWWYDEWDGKKNQTEFIDALYQLKEDNENLDVMWTCHKTPPKIITEKFDYKEYENIGLEWGAYDKVLNDMDLDDDTFLFFIQDDMVVHDWSFINVCIDHFNQFPTTKVIGNGWNYPWDINPLEEARLSYWLKNGYNWRDYAKEENKHLIEYYKRALNNARELLVELNGLEPLTFWLPARRSPNCAIAPKDSKSYLTIFLK